MKKIMLSAIMASMALAASAQKMGLSVGLETGHLWRGYEVANGLIATGDVSFNAGGFSVGMWGGTGFTSNEANPKNYHEFDYHIGYAVKGFSVALWDIYNFANDRNAGGNNIFDYKKGTTGHFVDLQLGYNFDAACNLPLALNWNTIIAGCDMDGNDRQFSTYVQAAYTVYRDEHWNVTPSIGGAFKFNGDSKSNFYGGSHKAFFNDLRLTTGYNLKIKNYTMPIGATAMWNPEAKKGYFAVNVGLVNF